MTRYCGLRFACALLALFAGACGQKKTHASKAPSSGRVVAVSADPKDEPTLAEFCEAGPSQKGPAFTYPELAEDSGTPTVARAGAWRWVNVWATWCAPCVEELPRLQGWQQELTKAGHKVALVLISADANAEAIQAFREKHPSTPSSVRVADPAELGTWATTLGLDPGATLPIHAFVDPQGTTRCARTGAVSDEDEALIAKLLAR